MRGSITSVSTKTLTYLNSADTIGTASLRWANGYFTNHNVSGTASNAYTLMGDAVVTTVSGIQCAGSTGASCKFADASIGSQPFGAAYLKWTRGSNLDRWLSVTAASSAGASNDTMKVEYNKVTITAADVVITALPINCVGKGNGTLWNNAGSVGVCP